MSSIRVVATPISVRILAQPDGEDVVISRELIGLQGPPGPPGGVIIVGHVATSADLPATWANVGEGIVADDTKHVYVWAASGWVDMGATTGPKGDKGDPGTAGAKGDPGPAGPAGAAGSAGPPGAAGAPGATGLPGPQGSVGPAGANGGVGPAGPTGPAGPVGPQGVKGDTGTSIILKGSVATIGDLPTGATVGDMYLVLADNNAYVWDGGQWDYAGPLQGPKGDTGPQGIPGTQGPAGAKGDQGNPGATGAAGPQGLVGPQGIKGDTGTPGATGPTGPAGADSTVPGPQGQTGPKGDTGSVGPQGIPGVPGPKGDKGDPGTSVVGTMIYKGDYMPNAYTVGDSVRYQGDLWVCVQDVAAGGAAPVGPYWERAVDVPDAWTKTEADARYAAKVHTHAQADVTGLSTALATLTANDVAHDTALAYRVKGYTTTGQPASPVAGDLWVDPSDSSIKVWDGAAFVNPSNAGGGTGLPWAVVSGGTVTEYTHPTYGVMQVHTFTGNGDLTVSTSGYAEMLLVSGGSATWNGIVAGGSGGAFQEGIDLLPAGTVPVVVGGGGTQSGTWSVSWGGMSSVGSKATAPAYPNGGAGGGPTGGHLTSDVDGTSRTYCGVVGTGPSGASSTGKGDGGAGAGTAGIVIVAVKKP